MDQQIFQSTAWGSCQRCMAGHWAFEPHPLPPDIQWDTGLILLLSQADAALSELSGLGENLPNPHMLIAPLMRREAELSSRIEGTQTTFEQLLIAEVAKAPAHEDASRRDDRHEVMNYVRAMEQGIKLLDTLPLSLRLVRELHRVLMQGVRGDKATPGEFRRFQNLIGSPGDTPGTARFVPPAPENLERHLQAWESYMNRAGEVPDIIQCAYLHQQFETIHPFLDGNGRVGRLMITLFLMSRGRLHRPLLYLSAYIEKHKEHYYALLLRVSTHGDWPAWLRFFLAGVNETARDAVRRTRRILALREEYRRQVSQERAALTGLVDELFVTPYVTAAHAARVMGATAPTARKAIERLTELGMLREITGQAWGRIWCASAVMSALHDPLDPAS